MTLWSNLGTGLTYFVLFRSHQDSNSELKSGSVGKLKLTNEMKEKLEAVTGSRKNSVRSNASSSKRSELEIAPETVEVRKLSENRKLLMEQKLGGGDFFNFKISKFKIFIFKLL